MKKLILYILLFLTAFQFVEAQRPTLFRYGINLNGFPSDPIGYKEGDLYWNTTTKRVRQYNGTIWEDLLGVVQNIEDLATTQIIDIGDIGSDAIEDGFNAFTFSEDIQEQSEGYVIINTTQNGEAEQYLFVGEGGDYGVGGTLTAVADDFVLLNEETDLGLYVPYDGATRDVNLGLNNLTLGQNLFLSETGNGLSSQGLGFQVSPNNNGRYIIRLNANNESSPGLNFLPEGNYRTSFKDVNGLEILRINTNSLLAPFANTSNSTNAQSVIVRNVMESYVASQLGSNELNTVVVSTETYTLLESGIQNHTIYYLTYEGDQTITIPEITYSSPRYIQFIKETSGTVTIIPSENVNQQQYVFDSTDLAQTLYTRQDDVYNLWRGSATVSAYVPPSANIILNSTFDDSSNVTFDNPPFSIGSGIVSFTNNVGNFTFDLTEDMTANTAYTFTVDILNGTGNTRFRLFVNQGGSFVEVVGNTTYSDGLATQIGFTTPVGVDSSQIRITTSSIATSFELDNAMLTQD